MFNTLAVLAVVTIGSIAGIEPSTRAGAAPGVKPLYDLAMGDSLAAGVGASVTATRYVNVLYQHELTRFPTLQLDNVACSGATTTSVISGPGCSYATGTQLGDAEAFLRAHPRQVAFVTIDIGANDVDGCLAGGTVSNSCVQGGLSHISADLPEIIRGLRSAYPGVAIYGMNYYDPFLGLWLTGSSGQALAAQSVGLLGELNGLLNQLYSAGSAAMADVATPFQSSDFTLTGSYLGAIEPQNVADACNWTLFCSNAGNIHANDVGHGIVAGSFTQLIDSIAVSPLALPLATVATTYTGQLTALGGHPRFRWSLAAGSGPLPSGMRLRADGSLSGTPAVAGTYPLKVQVTDTRLKIPHSPASNQATGNMSLTVLP